MHAMHKGIHEAYATSNDTRAKVTIVYSLNQLLPQLLPCMNTDQHPHIEMLGRCFVTLTISKTPG